MRLAVHRGTGYQELLYIFFSAARPATKDEKTTHGLWEKRAPIAEAVYIGIYMYTYIYT